MIRSVYFMMTSMLCVFVQNPKAATKRCLCFCATCLQDDEIAYYNAKDNVSALLFPSCYLFSFYFSASKYTGHTETWASNMLFAAQTALSLSHVLPFTSSSSLFSLLSSFLYLCTNLHIFFIFFRPSFPSVPQPLLPSLPILPLLQAFLPE